MTTNAINQKKKNEETTKKQTTKIKKKTNNNIRRGKFKKKTNYNFYMFSFQFVVLHLWFLFFFFFCSVLIKSLFGRNCSCFSRLQFGQSGLSSHFPLGKWLIWGYVLVSFLFLLHYLSSCGSGCVQSHFCVSFLSVSHCSFHSASVSCFFCLLLVLPCWLLLLPEVLLFIDAFF